MIVPIQFEGLLPSKHTENLPTTCQLVFRFEIKLNDQDQNYSLLHSIHIWTLDDQSCKFKVEVIRKRLRPNHNQLLKVKPVND